MVRSRIWIALAALLLPLAAPAQIYVYPRRPNKSQVRHFEFDWQYIDILVGPEADTQEADDARRRVAPAETEGGGVPRGVPRRSELPAPASGLAQNRPEGPETAAPAEDAEPPPQRETPAFEVPDDPDRIRLEEAEGKPLWDTDLAKRSGGVRLYFYERERPIAERAAAQITDAYRYLVEQFQYVPTQTFPYILYSTYREFLQTNLFPLQEGTLGVTSPRDLKLTLPYFGDHRLFTEVSTHEMVHQFTVQKVRTVAQQANLWGDPLGGMPLWFIEGLAEFYAQHGIDPEAEMLVRDIVVNPDFMQGYAMLDFFEDRPYSVLWTYKVGQMRVAFLEETYGEGTLQRIIDRSYLLVGSLGTERQFGGFPELLRDVTGDEPRVLSARFEQWLKRRSYRTYLDSGQSSTAVRPIEEWGGDRANALDASPDGNVLMYRAIDADTGRVRLMLMDWRNPGVRETVASDGRPGAESLHVINPRNFDVGRNSLVYVAESNGRDLLYWQTYRHEARYRTEEEREAETAEAYRSGRPLRHEADDWEIDLSLGRKTSYDLGKRDLIALESPSLSPDGGRVAFVGLSMKGLKDIYVLEPRPDGAFELTQVTDDDWAERHVAWGPDGIVFTSDATGHGHYNLFLADPDRPGRIRRLTTDARDHQDPTVLPNGDVFFITYDHARADVHQVVDGAIVRRTDVATGFFDVSPGPEGGLWALWHQAGQRRPVRIPQDALMDMQRTPVEPGEPARDLPVLSVADASRYDALKLDNWELGNVFGFFGAGSGGVYGQLLASGSDRLRDHGLLLNVFVYGSFDLTDGYLLYVNQRDRLNWGTGLFQSLLLRRDRTFDNLPFRYTSIERFFGALGSFRYPFNTYQYVQADVALGGVRYSLTPETRLVLASPEFNGTGRDLLEPWDAANAGTRVQAETSLRLGHDTIRYHRSTGPLSGSSLMAEATASVQPFDQVAFGNFRLDAEHYISLAGRTNFFLRGSTGTGWGGRYARQFYLSSFDTLRGVPFGNEDYLLGSSYFFTTAELQLPLNSIIRFILFSDIEAILGADFGGVGDSVDEIWDKRVLDLVAGFNFGFGPLVFRLHFAKPVDIGGDPQEAGLPAGLPNNGDWVTNFSLGWLYM